MTAMSNCYNLSGSCASPSFIDRVNEEPPEVRELFGEAALTLAIPLVLAILVSFVLPIIGLAAP